MKYMIIFDVIIAVLGIYLVYTALRMNQMQKISTLLVNQDAIAKCRDKKGFIQSVYKKMAGFGAGSIVFGALGCINDTICDFGRAYNIVSVCVYFVAWFLFSREMRKDREKFF